jgi:valyl-tRNA synthetase
MSKAARPSSVALRPSPGSAEIDLQQCWQEDGVYRFEPTEGQPVFSIDTPPPTVSGALHIGHVCSYSQADFIARYHRMRGDAVFYPMGYDDNGLPTERLIEQRLGQTAESMGHTAFVAACETLSRETEQEYAALWRRLGLSVDWRYTYRTIDAAAQRIAQWSFLDLLRQGRVYRKQAPAIWCPTCRTAIAQAELEDMERPSEFFTLAFRLDDGAPLPIATTRPELLPACVAIFVHPEDPRFHGLVGHTAISPLGERVPILADPAADPAKGSGAVMCCTFGDSADVDWWRSHDLPLKEIIGRDGRLTAAAGSLAGLSVAEARRQLVDDLAQGGFLLARQPINQAVRVHERCDTPVEYVVAAQWFVRLLDAKEQLLTAGAAVQWRPATMHVRYRNWVDNIRWDWCISRQRHYGVPFPLWYCASCGAVLLAQVDELPVDPRAQPPSRPCACGSRDFLPEQDVMDTWATSSLTPQIAGRRLEDPQLYARVYPFSLRPQAHEIIRTWAFYTIAKQQFHFDSLPWHDLMISGWVLANDGTGKISKSRGGSGAAPLELIERYSADAVRYWASSAGLGKDVLFNEEKIRAGVRLVTKLQSIGRFAQRFLAGYQLPAQTPALAPIDRWLLSQAQRLVQHSTDLLEQYDYAGARQEAETFVWKLLADNYLEFAKQRLYDPADSNHAAACFTLHRALFTAIALLASYLPHVTDNLYRSLYRRDGSEPSIHVCRWPEADASLINTDAEVHGETLLGIATAVRRHKSEAGLAMGAELALLELAVSDATLAQTIADAQGDLRSVTRARRITVVERPSGKAEPLGPAGAVMIGVLP